MSSSNDSYLAKDKTFAEIETVDRIIKAPGNLVRKMVLALDIVFLLYVVLNPINIRVNISVNTRNI